MLNKKLKLTLGLTTALITLSGCQQKSDASATPKSELNAAPTSQQNQQVAWPKVKVAVKEDQAVAQKVQALLNQMTLAQKVAQMIQPEIRDITVEDMRKYGFGSYLNGGGAFPNNNKHASVQDWVSLAEQMYQASIDGSLDGIAIPTMWGTDAVHGHNNVIGATLFPHNIGLGAMHDAKLIKKIAQATAKEVLATGIDWVFAPTVAVVQDLRWGRSYESYSSDPELVKQYAKAIVEGLQGEAKQDFLSQQHVLSTVKHFVGDGGTQFGIDQGNNLADEQTLRDVHAQGYYGGLAAGAQTVMASFNSWQGNKVHGSEYLLTNVLKQQMGFNGFVVGDWNGHGQVAGCSNDSCPQAINAGLDMFMAPTASWKALFNHTIEQVQQGVIPQARIDDAVRRILTVKFRAGLFDKPSPAHRELAAKTDIIGAAEHRAIAAEAVRKSLVLLKNNAKLLPLSPKQHILLAGDGADNIGKQSGGWTITWQGTGNQNSDFPGAHSILSGFAQQITAAGGSYEYQENGEYQQKPDVAVVVFGEQPYAEGQGDRKHLAYSVERPQDLALLTKLKQQNIPVVSVFLTGRPMWINPEINQSDAFVVAWLPGSEGQAIADVLLQDNQGKVQYDFQGRLPFAWPEQANVNANNATLLPREYGLSYQASQHPLVTDKLNEQAELQVAEQAKNYVYQRQAIAPWQAMLVNGDNQQLISSNAQHVDGLSFRTSDKTVQEDAFTLTFSGDTKAKFTLVAEQAQNLTKLSEQALVFAVKTDSIVQTESKLLLALGCEQENPCQSAVNIASDIAKLSKGNWHQVALDLTCVNQQGVDLADVKTVFSLTSNQPLSLSLSDIQLTQTTEQMVKLSCQQ